MSRYLIAIDVGNSATSIGAFDVSRSPRYPAPQMLLDVPTSFIFKKIFSSHLMRAVKSRRIQTGDIRGVYVSSVVPHVQNTLRKVILARLGGPVHFVSVHTPSSVPVRYRHPSEVGADRIVNARGALAYHNGPLIVVDFGTATTFDCVSKKGEYLGGVIAAGPVMSAEALYLKTAKLPYVRLKKPSYIIGRDTKESILAGVYYGHRGLVKEVVERLKGKLGKRTYVIATGGQARWMLQGISSIDRFIPELTLIGLYHLWRDAHPSAN